MDTINLPFDQYQRYMDIKKVIDFFPKAKQAELLDVGGYPGLIRKFVNGPKITITDIEPASEIENYIKADATKLPFDEGSFSTVISSDTLEHIPSGKRNKFLSELIRVGKDNLVITAPFSSEAVRLAEDIFQEYFVRNFGYEFGTLKEHQVNGLPDFQDTTNHLLDNGFKIASFPSGGLYNWLLMMLVKTSFWTIPESKKLETMFDCLYNAHYYEQDHVAPSYRMVIVASKDKTVDLDKIPQSFNNHSASNEASLNQSYFLALLTSLINLRQKDTVNILSDDFKNIYQLIKDKDVHINNLEAINLDKDERIRQLEIWMRNVQKSSLYRMYAKVKSLTGKKDLDE